MLIIGGSGSGKTNALLSLIKEQDDIDWIYLYAKDLSEPKYEFLTKKCKDAGTKHINDSNAFIKCSKTMDYVSENIDDYNPNRKRKILIVFDDMSAWLMLQKELTLIKQIHSKNICFVIIGIFKTLYLNLNHMFVINVMIF